MLKNKAYVYGDEFSSYIPDYVHWGKLLLHRFWSYRDQVAIINAESDERVTYGEVAQRAVDTALSLARLGVKLGDVVSICSEKRLEFMPTLLGIVCSGATFAPAVITCGRATMLHRVNLVKPKVMFISPKGYETQKDTLKSIDSLQKFILFGDKCQEGVILFKDFLTETARVEDFTPPPTRGWEEYAVIVYSSGTTGLPKGIPLTHLNFILFTTNKIDGKYYKNKTVLNTREWYYTYGMSFSLACLYHGATIVYSPRNQCEDFLEAIQKYKIKIMQVAPATIVEMIKSPFLEKYDVSSLERMLSASTPLDAELVKMVQDKFTGIRELCQLYGMSELGGICSDELAPKGPKAGSVGWAIPGLVVKIVDLETRVPLGPNQRGEICVKSQSLTPGYLCDTTFEHLDEELGFFKTGDVGYYDEDNYFFIIDRIKELIKFNSFQVAPAELESVLQQHPSVREAGVVGAPHPQYLEVPTAFVVLQPGATISPQELVAYVDTQVSRRMRLEGGVRIIKELPRGGDTKLDRKALKLML